MFYYFLFSEKSENPSNYYQETAVDVFYLRDIVKFCSTRVKFCTTSTSVERDVHKSLHKLGLHRNAIYQTLQLTRRCVLQQNECDFRDTARRIEEIYQESVASPSSKVDKRLDIDSSVLKTLSQIHSVKLPQAFNKNKQLYNMYSRHGRKFGESKKSQHRLKRSTVDMIRIAQRLRLSLQQSCKSDANCSTSSPPRSQLSYD